MIVRVCSRKKANTPKSNKQRMLQLTHLKNEQNENRNLKLYIINVSVKIPRDIPVFYHSDNLIKE